MTTCAASQAPAVPGGRIKQGAQASRGGAGKEMCRAGGVCAAAGGRRPDVGRVGQASAGLCAFGWPGRACLTSAVHLPCWLACAALAAVAAPHCCARSSVCGHRLLLPACPPAGTSCLVHSPPSSLRSCSRSWLLRSGWPAGCECPCPGHAREWAGWHALAAHTGRAIVGCSPPALSPPFGRCWVGWRSPPPRVRVAGGRCCCCCSLHGLWVDPDQLRPIEARLRCAQS